MELHVKKKMLDDGGGTGDDQKERLISVAGNAHHVDVVVLGKRVDLLACAARQLETSDAAFKLSDQNSGPAGRRTQLT